MKMLWIAGLVLVVAGCAGPRPIISSTPNEVVVKGIPSDVAAAGSTAQQECAKYGKRANYQGQLGIYAHKFTCE